MWIVGIIGPHYPEIYELFEKEVDARYFYELEKAGEKNSSGRYEYALYIAKVKEKYEFTSGY